MSKYLAKEFAHSVNTESNIPDWGVLWEEWSITEPTYLEQTNQCRQVRDQARVARRAGRLPLGLLCM